MARIEATSVNIVDTMIRNLGADLSPISPGHPARLGMDFAETIEEVAEALMALLWVMKPTSLQSVSTTSSRSIERSKLS